MLAAELERLGYETKRETFDVSPRRLFAVTVVAAGLGWTALIVFPLLVLPVPRWIALAISVAALALVGVVGYGVAEGLLPSGQPTVSATNLSATKGTPHVWLVAHGDSKSQFLSLRGRVIAVVLAGLGVVGLSVCLVFRLAGPVDWWIALPVTLIVIGAGAALVRDPLGDDSNGAVDNATGVVAAIVAGAMLGDRPDVGVLITDAEELGMEGARAWVRLPRPGEWFVNFDGLDARGRFRIMEHRGRGRARNHVTAVAEPVEQAMLAADLTPVRRPLPPGVLVDGVALAAGGMSGVTLSRGDWDTLGVLHTRDDALQRTDVSGAMAAGAAAARAIALLLG